MIGSSQLLSKSLFIIGKRCNSGQKVPDRLGLGLGERQREEEEKKDEQEEREEGEGEKGKGKGERKVEKEREGKERKRGRKGSYQKNFPSSIYVKKKKANSKIHKEN